MLCAACVGAGCSSSSTLVGAGACEAYCLKWIGAKCKGAPTHDGCLDECTFYQTQCQTAQDDYLRCATNEGTVSCDGDTGQPHSVGCNKWIHARDRACTTTFVPDAGSDDAPLTNAPDTSAAFDTSPRPHDGSPLPF